MRVPWRLFGVVGACLLTVGVTGCKSEDPLAGFHIPETPATTTSQVFPVAPNQSIVPRTSDVIRINHDAAEIPEFSGRVDLREEGAEFSR